LEINLHNFVNFMLTIGGYFELPTVS